VGPLEVRRIPGSPETLAFVRDRDTERRRYRQAGDSSGPKYARALRTRIAGGWGPHRLLLLMGGEMYMRTLKATLLGSVIASTIGLSSWYVISEVLGPLLSIWPPR
jgi:hypothetical protein